jgi:hypothetical protein
MLSSTATFPCPSCREFINSDATTCRFCSAPVDPQAAGAAIEFQDKINRACNDASLVRNLAGAMWVFFFARFIPFFGFFAGIAMFILFLVIPVRLVIWQVRFGGIQTADVDYKGAKRQLLVALGLWLLMIVVLVVLMLLTAGVVALFDNRA